MYLSVRRVIIRIFMAVNNCYKPREDRTIISLSKALTRRNDSGRIKEMPDEILRQRLHQKDVRIGTALVSFHAKRGELAEAKEAFDQLTVKDVVSWTALISGYSQQGHGNEALYCFEKMQHQGFSPNAVTFLSILKACGSIGAVERGEEVHAQVIREGLLKNDSMLGTAVVDMYAKCGAMSKAQQAFDQLSVQDVVSWNAIIAGYAEHGPHKKALDFLECMQRQCISPDSVTFVCILKACSNIGAVEKGGEIHAEIIKEGLLGKNMIIGNALVNMYIKCNAFAKAQEVFHGLPIRVVASWNALIGGYARNGHGQEALNCFVQMQLEGFSPNAVTLVCILTACSCLGNIDKGREIHAEIIQRERLRGNAYLSTALVDMYAKSGAISRAQEVFDDLSSQEIVSWNAIITGCTQHRHVEQAVNYFMRMPHEGLCPDMFSFSCILKAYGSIGTINKGKEIHAAIIKESKLMKHTLLGTALVDMYAKCGLLTKAKEVFERLEVHDTVCWTALITGYTHYGYMEEVIECFEKMQDGGFIPDALIFSCVLKACSSIGAVEKGNEIHAEIIQRGLLENVGTTLMYMYAKCGENMKVQDMFDELKFQDIHSWNAVMTGYSESGHGENTWYCFQRMQNEGFLPDRSTICCVLKACATTGAIEKGKKVHAAAVKEGSFETDSMVGSALVDMYVKCHAHLKAQEVLDDLMTRDVFTWGTIIAGYVQQGDADEALRCFELMVEDGVSADPFAFACALKACGIIGAMDKGEEIHVRIVCKGLSDIYLWNALVDMYARCGSLTKAHEIFKQFHARDLVSWTVLLAGYAHLGDDDIVVHLLAEMLREGIRPDVVTFMVVLNVFSHSGLLEKGQMYFEAISIYYSIVPTFEHYTSMVDLFSRAGCFAEAVSLITSMPYHDYLPIWTALLGACQKWGNLELGQHAFGYALQLDETYATAYVCMSNIYSTSAT